MAKYFHLPWLIFLVGLASGCEKGQQFEVLDAQPVYLLSDERTIFVNYWAVWCTPCIEEMPILAEFRTANLDRLEVYAVNFDNPSIEQLRADVAKLDVRIPSLLADPAEALGMQTPTVLPTTLVVRQGKVVDTLLGPQTIETLSKVL
jgi:thiol-disulfide isomerase/thioredoxin